MTPEPGLVVSFAGPGGELPGVVRSIEGDLVVVDFNHPLAGKELIFDVSILKVEPIQGAYAPATPSFPLVGPKQPFSGTRVGHVAPRL